MRYLFCQVEELPFLLTRAGELECLKKTISDLDVFYRLSESEDGVFELIKAWKTVCLKIFNLDINPVSPADQYKCLCKQCRSK